MSAVDEAREAAWRALRDDVTRLAHLTPDDWAGRRGADRIARTINACRDLIYEHQPLIEAAVRAEYSVERLDAAIHASHFHGRQLTMTDAEADRWLAEHIRAALEQKP